MRTVKVKVLDLIKKIRENKEAHIKDYNEAVVAYREKAAEEIERIKKELAEGSLKLGLQLVTPINNEKEYDKLISMFTWEQRDEVELDYSEFNQYVLDEMHFAVHARTSNSLYKK